MLRFDFHPTPNPAKVALFLEESGLTYQLVPVDTSKGEQHQPLALTDDLGAYPRLTHGRSPPSQDPGQQ
jgi:glutathione S-transferase